VITTLVVDDEPRIADIHAAYVGKVPGFSVLGLAHTGAEAFDLVATARPDLLLLDLYLPDEHGLDLLQRIHDAHGHRPDTVVITASRDVDSVRRALQLGALHYVVKPFGFRQLADRLESYRALREGLRRLRDTNQADVDKLFELSRGGPGVGTAPPVHTMMLVLGCVEKAADPPTATEVAGSVGISRPTAQRYLAQLVTMGLLELDLQYGTVGRPSHRYRASAPANPSGP
jgi:response regulator of citrate/malate metabolism